jgi:hypothetical protein
MTTKIQKTGITEMLQRHPLLHNTLLNMFPWQQINTQQQRNGWRSGPPVVLLINCLILRYPFNHDYGSDVEENDHHCLHILLTFHQPFVPFKNSYAGHNIITAHLL